MRFHLLDRIESWTPGERAAGIKAVTRMSPMPGRTPVIESMAQLASYLLGDAEARDGRRVLSLMTGVDRLAFHRDARPGDRLVLEARIQARSIEGARVAVSARAGDEPVCDGRLSFAFFAPADAGQARDFEWTRAHLRLLLAGHGEAL